eukprot:Blabericola_migrator_1__6639@NODE_334_length_9665_cov_140_658158_g270_i0_p2_GENE_NODE_334_length_9665_cov_140_658158_g270_i0NODE_334_length_9665_cov_140_658158_g270_i0_p2_ORF_typecomplete_len670_score98_08AAA_7/PF12775_7/0_026DUF3528/PF12045_8/2_8e02DUF3528/PF12045_8/0_96AAA_22/PF13401_6/0_18TniB/PF05621_11/2_4TniB/PF05621_11/71SAPS/PF04499_15/0_25_NODE_334_length_9665_cov_140_658158_g270_i064258434
MVYLTESQRARLNEAQACLAEKFADFAEARDRRVSDFEAATGDRATDVKRTAFETVTVGETISLDALYEHLRWVGDELMYQHRCVSFCQSSGCGKSRTIRELAQRYYVCYLPFAASTRSSQWPPESSLAQVLLTALECERSTICLTNVIPLLSAILATLRSAIEDGNMSPAEWFNYIQSAEMTRQVAVNLRNNTAEQSILYVEPTLTCLRRANPALNHPGQDVIIFAFDEASALLTPSWIEGFSLLRLLRRACSQSGVASIYLSTDPKVYNPPSKHHRDSALRISVVRDYEMPRPLTSVVLPDCFLESRNFEASLSILDTAMWMSFYGRPLWQAVARALLSVGASETHTNREILGFAEEKLQLGVPTSAVAVASLLCRLTVLPSAKLAETLLTSHMAQLLNVSSDRELTYITYASEPLLAWPAFIYFKGSADTIISATAEAIHNGCLAAGVAGEIFVRFALVLQRSQPGFEKLNTFQRSIFEDSNAPDDAFINFIQFVWITEELNEDLLLSAFERKAALVPRSPERAGYDLVIPVWRGNADQPLRSGQIGAVLIKVGYENAAVSRRVFLRCLEDATAHLELPLTFWAFQREPLWKEADDSSALWECSLERLSRGSECLDHLLNCEYEPAQPFRDEQCKTHDSYHNLMEYSARHNASVIQLRAKSPEENR